MKTVSIGNGLYARSRQRPSRLAEYRHLQAVCPHVRRDPRGVCYRCGHRATDGEWAASPCVHCMQPNPRRDSIYCSEACKQAFLDFSEEQ